jgi:hypothetical protein
MVEFEEVKRYRFLAAQARRTGEHAVNAATKATYEDIALQYDILADCAGELKHRPLH